MWLKKHKFLCQFRTDARAATGPDAFSLDALKFCVEGSPPKALSRQSIVFTIDRNRISAEANRAPLAHQEARESRQCDV